MWETVLNMPWYVWVIFGGSFVFWIGYVFGQQSVYSALDELAREGRLKIR